MAYVLVTSPCYGCGRLFGYHPHLVPSQTIDGTRQPFCLSCIERANPKRIANGLEPIVPLPGAYEPCEESEL